MLVMTWFECPVLLLGYITFPSEQNDCLPQSGYCLHSTAPKAVSNRRRKLGLIQHPFSQTDIFKTDQYSQRKAEVNR